MPPRRSCFPERDAADARERMRFQCHHGVPASGNRPQPLGERIRRFNATTAFLLRKPARRWPRRWLSFQCHHGVPASRPGPGRAGGPRGVSMPPRRSCFKCKMMQPPLFVVCFNATTAFLLPWPASATSRACRSFQCHHGVPASVDPGRFWGVVGRGFNATTAFLLLRTRRLI